MRFNEVILNVVISSWKRKKKQICISQQASIKFYFYLLINATFVISTDNNYYTNLNTPTRNKLSWALKDQAGTVNCINNKFDNRSLKSLKSSVTNIQ